MSLDTIPTLTVTEARKKTIDPTTTLFHATCGLAHA